MSHKHTPGPWIASQLHLNYSGFVIVRDMGYGVRRLDQEAGKFTKADALLIAAAPDLLAACEEMAQFDEERYGPNISLVVRLARAALSKARGE